MGVNFLYVFLAKLDSGVIRLNSSFADLEDGFNKLMAMKYRTRVVNGDLDELDGDWLAVETYY